MDESHWKSGHVFLSYAREDSAAADRLQRMLESAGIRVWRDSSELWPGEDWRARIRSAITSDALVFIACFSSHAIRRSPSYQNEELTLAVAEMRRRPVGEPWLIPVRLDDCEIPDREIDATRTLRSLHQVDLFDSDGWANADRLVASVRRILDRQAGPDPSGQPGPPELAPKARPTFGIITALPEELVAMSAMIGDRRELTVPGDHADYMLGTVPSRDRGRPHQVVLTQLGETGNDAASRGCTNLIRSFGSVRCVLMVGIAAGIPNVGQPGRHVRLGDVVVSLWGIAEYDSVTDAATGPLPRRTFPAASPTLRQCANRLTASELLGQRTWEEWLASAAQRLPEFGRPDDSTDVLYATDESDERVAHPDVTLSGHRPGWPRVHPGMIASGDRSLRSTHRRDEIAASQPDLRAIEMEGKGVGNTGFFEGVEWLVIRGISDYGDARVKRTWRNYAALAAAAYTRALLAECRPLAPSPRSVTPPEQAAYPQAAAPERRQWRPGPVDRGLAGSLACSFTSHAKAVLGGEFSPDGSLFATCGEDSTARLWDTGTGAPRRTMTGHTAGVNSVAFSPGGDLLATGSEDHTARLWRVADGACVAALSGHGAAVWRVAFSPAGPLLATAGYDSTARLWRADEPGAPARVLAGHDAPVLGVAFSPDGRLLATASEDGTARLWQVGTGSAAGPLTGHAGRVWQVRFGADGSRVATAGEDGTARLWDAATGSAVAVLADHRGDLNAIAFSPDGRQLATAGEDGTARLWDGWMGAARFVLAGHDGPVLDLAFSPDGRLIATASADMTARLWDAATGAPVGILSGPDSAVWLVSFDRDGTLLATADDAHVVRLWEPAATASAARSH